MNHVGYTVMHPTRCMDNMKTFICELCHKEFEKLNSDEESLLESQLLFGNYPEEELVDLCDDCYQKVVVPVLEN